MTKIDVEINSKIAPYGRPLRVTSKYWHVKFNNFVIDQIDNLSSRQGVLRVGVYFLDIYHNTQLSTTVKIEGRMKEA